MRDLLIRGNNSYLHFCNRRMAHKWNEQREIRKDTENLNKS